MHPYIVVVRDSSSHKTILSIPCAESETAVLVQKNLQSLFPQASIGLEVSNTASKTSSISLVQNDEKQNNFNKNDFAELEDDLFNDVA